MRWFKAAFRSVKTANCEVGIPFLAINSFDHALEASIWAAFWKGPTQWMPYKDSIVIHRGINNYIILLLVKFGHRSQMREVAPVQYKQVMNHSPLWKRWFLQDHRFEDWYFELFLSLLRSLHSLEYRIPIYKVRTYQHRWSDLWNLKTFRKFPRNRVLSSTVSNYYNLKEG